MSAADTEHPPARPGAWSTIREAIRGSGQDYTRGSVGRSVVLLAIPMVLEMVLESLFAVTNVFFVGRLGADAVSVVGLTESLLAVVYAFAMGLGIAVTATVARRIGEQDPDAAARAAAQGVLIGLMVALVFGGLGAWLAPDLLALMGASPEVVATGAAFTRIILGGEASVILLFLLNAAFRGAGDAAIAMRILWLSSGLNIVLDPCLIFGLGPFPELGVTGAAVATTIGRSVGALVAFRELFRPGRRFQVRWAHFRPAPALMGHLVRLSGAAVFQFIIGTASWIGLVRILAGFGSQALAGYTIGIRIVIFAILPSWGLSNAAATMVGQGLGSGQPERAERAVWTACKYNFAFLAALGLVFVIGAPAIAGLFTSDPAVRALAADCLRVIAAGFPAYAFGMVLTQSFNGAGDTWTPTWINLGIFWLGEIPLAWVLAYPAGMGPHGAFLAVALAFSLLAAVSAVIFRRGRWKLVRV